MTAMPTTVYTTDAQRYAAVLSRDSAANGVFFYAVVTTGVFCKPSCGSRAPRRENVRFFESTAAAERAGFRACKRCKPTARLDQRAELVARICSAIDASENVPSLDTLAGQIGMSPYHLHRVFREMTGVTPRDYATERRRQRTRRALENAGSVTEAIYDAGFESSGRFYAEADDTLGMPPRAFKNQGEGMALRHASAPCALGHVLVAATARGICAIDIGTDAQGLTRELKRRFAKAMSVIEDDSLGDWLTAIIAHIESGTPVDVPLDVRGTLLQQRVWAALRAIPRGETRSYAEIAQSLGMPKAVRAVASACGKNTLAVIVPCHRVIGSDGKLRGYRWGIATKKHLLEMERLEMEGHETQSFEIEGDEHHRPNGHG